VNRTEHKKTEEISHKENAEAKHTSITITHDLLGSASGHVS
jgi:hypothetical protein